MLSLTTLGVAAIAGASWFLPIDDLSRLEVPVCSGVGVGGRRRGAAVERWPLSRPVTLGGGVGFWVGMREADEVLGLIVTAAPTDCMNLWASGELRTAVEAVPVLSGVRGNREPGDDKLEEATTCELLLCLDLPDMLSSSQSLLEQVQVGSRASSPA